MNQLDATKEVREKTLAKIHVETAEVWTKRAIAFYTEAVKATGDVACELWKGYDDARHEALEHAALAEDEGQTVGRIERLIDRTVKRLKRKDIDTRSRDEVTRLHTTASEDRESRR